MLPSWGQSLRYLRHDSVDLSDFPAPPIAGSELDLADLAQVTHWQQSRTAEDCARAHQESHGYATSFFGEPYGPLNSYEAQLLVDFQERMFKEVNYFSRILKQRYSRLRPFARDERINPCIPLHHSNAYPSGHAAISYVAAHTFAMIYPARAQAFWQRAREISLGRVIGGVHYPLDIEAGTLLGQRIHAALLQSPEFLTELKSFTP